LADVELARQLLQRLSGGVDGQVGKEVVTIPIVGSLTYDRTSRSAIHCAAAEHDGLIKKEK